MERVLSSIVASLCVAPLFYVGTSWLLITLNQDTHGPDSRLAVAYLSTFGGFAATIFGFFLIWFLTNNLLMPHYLRVVQIFDAIGIVGWVIVYFSFSAQQPQRLDYDGHRAVLEVELRATKALLDQRPIDSVIQLNYCGGTDFTIGLSDPVREEGQTVILSWQTVPYEVKEWKMCVFLENRPILFPLDLPKRPTQSTDWSGWIKPVQYQDSPLPEEALANLTLRYRFRLIPYGQQ